MGSPILHHSITPYLYYSIGLSLLRARPGVALRLHGAVPLVEAAVLSGVSELASVIGRVALAGGVGNRNALWMI